MSTRRLLRWVTPARRDSIEAALAEAEAAPSAPEARSWRRAARALLWRGVLLGPIANLLALVAVISAVVVLNSSASDVSAQETLLGIVLGATLVGFLWARHAWLVALAVGATVAAQHVISLALGIPEPSMHLPHGWLSTTSLLILVLPAMVGAYTGAGIRRLTAKR